MYLSVYLTISKKYWESVNMYIANLSQLYIDHLTRTLGIERESWGSVWRHYWNINIKLASPEEL